jgi:hypothetical protein
MLVAGITGIDIAITFRLLRALAVIGLVASEDERTFHSLPPLETLLSETPGSLRQLAMVSATTPAQYLPWGYFLQGIKTGVQQATTALGSDIFDYYAHHPEEAAIFQKTMQVNTAGVTAEIGQRLDTSKASRRWRNPVTPKRAPVVGKQRSRCVVRARSLRLSTNYEKRDESAATAVLCFRTAIEKIELLTVLDSQI